MIGCNRWETPPKQPTPKTAEKTAVQDSTSSPTAPGPVELKILDFTGLQRLIASHRGQVVVVDAWSTSCPPCVRDFPHLVALNHKYAAEGLACVSLSFDYEGTGKPQDVTPPVLDFLRKQGAAFDNVLSSEKPDDMYTKLDFASVPEVFIYDRQGKLRERMQESAVGAKEKPLYDRVEILAQKLLAANAPPPIPNR
jgi:thiol-disulfide isomerase/thioredoxin